MGVNNLIAGSSGRVWWPEVISHDNTEECRAFCLEHAEQSFMQDTGLSLLPECTTGDNFTIKQQHCIIVWYLSHSIWWLVASRKEILYLSPLLLQICHMFYYCTSSYPKKSCRNPSNRSWFNHPTFSRANKNLWKHLESIDRIHKMCSLLVLEQLCPCYPVFDAHTLGASVSLRALALETTRSIAWQRPRRTTSCHWVDWWNMSRARRSRNEE